MNLYADLQAVQQASIALNGIDDDLIAQLLLSLADSIEKHSHFLLIENGKDLARMSPDNPKYDRLQLTENRLHGIAEDMRKVATLPSPVGELLSETQRPNGMTIKKVRVPFGVIGIIYEARPNVTADAAALCVKTGNAVVLRGGKEAINSNISSLSVFTSISHT